MSFTELGAPPPKNKHSVNMVVSFIVHVDGKSTKICGIVRGNKLRFIGRLIVQTTYQIWIKNLP